MLPQHVSATTDKVASKSNRGTQGLSQKSTRATLLRLLMKVEPNKFFYVLSLVDHDSSPTDEWTLSAIRQCVQMRVNFCRKIITIDCSGLLISR